MKHPRCATLMALRLIDQRRKNDKVISDIALLKNVSDHVKACILGKLEKMCGDMNLQGNRWNTIRKDHNKVLSILVSVLFMAGVNTISQLKQCLKGFFDGNVLGDAIVRFDFQHIIAPSIVRLLCNNRMWQKQIHGDRFPCICRHLCTKLGKCIDHDVSGHFIVRFDDSRFNEHLPSKCNVKTNVLWDRSNMADGFVTLRNLFLKVQVSVWFGPLALLRLSCVDSFVLGSFLLLSLVRIALVFSSGSHFFTLWLLFQSVTKMPLDMLLCVHMRSSIVAMSSFRTTLRSLWVLFFFLLISLFNFVSLILRGNLLIATFVSKRLVRMQLAISTFGINLRICVGKPDPQAATNDMLDVLCLACVVAPFPS